MDGVMYMHSQRMNRIRASIDTRVGKLKRIATQFSFCGGQEFDAGNIRTNSVLEPFGCLGDLGWYTIRFALWVMNYQAPKSVSARMLTAFKRDDSPDSVPMEIEGSLDFGDGVSSSFYNSFVTGHQQWAHVSGTEGVVSIPDFVLPYQGEQATFSSSRPEFTTVGCDFSMIENRLQRPVIGHQQLFYFILQHGAQWLSPVLAVCRWVWAPWRASQLCAPVGLLHLHVQLADLAREVFHLLSPMAYMKLLRKLSPPLAWIDSKFLKIGLFKKISWLALFTGKNR